MGRENRRTIPTGLGKSPFLGYGEGCSSQAVERAVLLALSTVAGISTARRKQAPMLGQSTGLVWFFPPGIQCSTESLPRAALETA